MSNAVEFSVSVADQKRNGLVFMISISLTYLIAPVTYVGVLHATILDSLQASDTVANLPEAVYLWTTALPVLIAWFWPSPKLLRPMLVSSLIVVGAAGALVALLFAMAPRSWWIPALVFHPAVVGISGGVQTMCIWELIGRGMSPELRSRTLGWTFGIGPLFAVLGSCVSQLILKGDFLGLINMTPVPAPWSYAILFGATCPAFWLSAAAVKLARVPPAPETQTGAQLQEIWDGLRGYFLNPLILVAAIGFLLTYGGTMITNNMSLYTQTVLGEAPEKYAGVQLALRFSFKCLMGFGLSWLVIRTHPKAAMLATTWICVVGVVWALFVPGKWYLISFGFLGGGELFYIYYLNYIVCCSKPERVRENTAYTNLITVLVGFMPLVFGQISDNYGLHASFLAAVGVLLIAIVVVQWRLPPQPNISDVGPS